MNVRDQHIVVIGAAKSGLAVARLVRENGAHVFVTDVGTIRDHDQQLLKKDNIEFESGAHSQRAFEGSFAIASPGVPDDAPIMQTYLNAGKAIYSEIEVASWFCEAQIIAVTGSNGKTTVTSWLEHVWRTASLTHVVAGNIGVAFSDVVASTSKENWALLEVSSFQLDHIDTFKPAISCILNITPDHLDRYENLFAKYAASKMRIMENQTENDIFITWNEDHVVESILEESNQAANGLQIWRFSSQSEVDNGIFVRDNEIIFQFDGQQEYLMNVGDIALPGRHNLHNGLATALVARAAGVATEHIRHALNTFEGVEHRLELVREFNGVRYINDSKATNVDAVWYALDSIRVPAVLIMGGRDKGNDYSSIIPLVKEKVHTLIAIGEAQAKLKVQFAEIVQDFRTAESMEEAVSVAKSLAQSGEVVMLSPACASFDMYSDYMHRGEMFRNAVEQLT